jgi:hypothetical protein
MRGAADLEREHQLVHAAVERSHAAVGFVPDAKVLEFGKDRSSGGQQLAHVAPVHAHEGDGPIPAECGSMTKRCLQEGRQGLARHLAGPHGEFTMVRARGPTDRRNPHNIFPHQPRG